jgi:hypothetical protein
MVTTNATTGVPITVSVDLARGGRWTSLRAAERDWLWNRADPARQRVRPGDPFVDAGGLEECFPTVRGEPDHGDAWSRPWIDLDSGQAVVEGDDFRLSRTLRNDGNALVGDYRLDATPGLPFIWAAHALLDLSETARLIAPPCTPTRLDDGTERAWPADLDTLGPADGTATGAILLGCPRVSVVDGAALSFGLEAPGQPVSVALWRNLGGWPQPEPYRSIGVEPMLGRVFDRDLAGPGDLAVVPGSGFCEWRLTVEARS